MSANAAVLLLLVGTLWVFIAYLDFRAYRFLQASQSAVLDCFSLVLVAAAGLVVFGEQLSLPKLVGIMLVMGAICISVLPGARRVSAGINLKLLALVLMSVALCIDKDLLNYVEFARYYFSVF